MFSIDSNVPGAKAAKSITDPRGRFYGGSQYREYCSASREDVLSVYRFDKYDGLTRLFGDTKLTSGLAFNEDARKMYHLGSCKLIITEFDWDPHTGNICNFDFSTNLFGLLCWIFIFCFYFLRFVVVKACNFANFDISCFFLHFFLIFEQFYFWLSNENFTSEKTLPILGNGRIVFDFQAHGYTLSSVLPFELAVDTDGFLYTVLQSGSVWVIDPWYLRLF